MKSFSHKFSDNSFYHRFLSRIILTLTILQVPINHSADVNDDIATLNYEEVTHPSVQTNYTATVSTLILSYFYFRPAEHSLHAYTCALA